MPESLLFPLTPKATSTLKIAKSTGSSLSVDQSPKMLTPENHQLDRGLRSSEDTVQVRYFQLATSTGLPGYTFPV